MLRISRKVGTPAPNRPHLPQHPEGRRPGGRPAAEGGFGVEDFQDVADGDVGEPTAFGSDDHGGAEQDVALRVRRDRGVILAKQPQLGEPFRVPGTDHVPGEFAFLPAGEQPRQRGPHDVGADRDQQRARHQLQPRPGVGAVALQPPRRAARPLVAGAVGAAGEPALLPGPAGLFFQPVQQQGEPTTTVAVDPGVRQSERRGGHQPQHRGPVVSGGRPVRRGGASREPGGQWRLLRRGRCHRGWLGSGGRLREDGPGQDGRHRASLPNSTSSVSGR